MRIDLIVKKDCALCDDARETLLRLSKELSFDVQEIDLASDPALHARHRYDVPVALLGGRVIAKQRIDAAELRRRLPPAYRMPRPPAAGGPIPKPEPSGARPVVRVSLSQVAASQALVKQTPVVAPRPKKKRPEPKAEPLPPLRLPPADAAILDVDAILGTGDARRLEAVARELGAEVTVGPATGRLTVWPASAAEALRGALGKLGLRQRGGLGAKKALALGLATVALGALAAWLRIGLGSEPGARIAAGASLLPLSWVLLRGGLRRLHLSSGSLGWVAGALLFVASLLAADASAVELAAAPAAAHLLGLALAIRLRGELHARLEPLRRIVEEGPSKTEETLRLEAGERLRVDGRLLAATSVDERDLGGDEAMWRHAGERVWAGSRFPEGGEVRPLPDERGVRVARALAMAERALGTGGGGFRSGGLLALLTLGVALVAGWLHGLPAAAAALAAAAPLAVVLLPSLAESAGIVRALRAGVAVRSAGALVRAGLLRRVLLGKRASLEGADPLVLTTTPPPEEDALAGIRLAAQVTLGVDHPVCRAIVAHARELGLIAPDAKPLRHLAVGAGASAEVGGKVVHVGTPSFLEAQGVSTEAMASFNLATGRRGSSPVAVSVDGEVVLLTEMGDLLADHAREAMGALELQGAEVHIASGSPQASAAWLAEAIGLEASVARGDLSAQGKEEQVEKLRPVLFAGGFADDRAALEAADLGLLMGEDAEAEEKVGAFSVRPDPRSVAALLAAGAATRKAAGWGRALTWAGTVAGLLLVAAGALGPVEASVWGLATSAIALGSSFWTAFYFR